MIQLLKKIIMRSVIIFISFFKKARLKKKIKELVDIALSIYNTTFFFKEV